DFFTALGGSATELHLASPNPLSSTQIQGVLSVSVFDDSGLFSGDQVSLHP
ncbi:MAG: hypothetical protein ACI841_004546, partial [Planctomycetota bacterium]